MVRRNAGRRDKHPDHVTKMRVSISIQRLGSKIACLIRMVEEEPKLFWEQQGQQARLGPLCVPPQTWMFFLFGYEYGVCYFRFFFVVGEKPTDPPTPIVRGEWENASQLIDEMRRKGLKPDRYSYTSAIHACSKARKPMEALRLLRAMEANNVGAVVVVSSWPWRYLATAVGLNAGAVRRWWEGEYSLTCLGGQKKKTLCMTQYYLKLQQPWRREGLPRDLYVGLGRRCCFDLCQCDFLLLGGGFDLFAARALEITQVVDYERGTKTSTSYYFF